MASKRRSELLMEQIQSISQEADQYAHRLRELESREDDANQRESSARKLAIDLKVMYEGGLDRTEAELLRQKLDKSQKELEEAQREAVRNRELAEIASLQAQTLGAFKAQHQEELQELKEFCAKLESKGDDELLIGRLQRQLMSTKTSYKAFVRKYQLLRGNM